MIRRTSLAAGACASALLLAGVSAGAFAANTPVSNWTKVTQQTNARAAGAIVFGTVTSTAPTGATIHTPSNGDVTVAFTPQTHFKGHSDAGTAAGYKSGDQVYIVGRYINGFTATNVQYDIAPFAVPLNVVYRGTVSSTANGALTLTIAGGKSVTLQTGSTTRFRINGQTSTTVPTIPARLRVVVEAQTLTNGSLLARSVVGGKAAASAVRVNGTIATVGQGSFTLTLANGQTATVTIASTTTFRVKGQIPAATPALAVGQKVVVTGTRQTDGSVLARVINIQTTA
jgi:hypothetical protein